MICLPFRRSSFKADLKGKSCNFKFNVYYVTKILLFILSYYSLYQWSIFNKSKIESLD